MALKHSEGLPVGWEAPDFDLIGTDEIDYSLKDFTDKEGLLVVFTCNHCPYAKAAWPILQKLHQDYGGEVEFVAINPNDDEVYPEDSFESMQQKVKEWDLQFPYLRDETQEVAKEYQAVCTPDPYLFRIEDSTPKLFYHGRINDNWQNPTEVEERSLNDAILAMLRGDNAPEDQPASMGCSIKWK